MAKTLTEAFEELDQMWTKHINEDLTPEEKVDAWHDGTRIVKPALCSTDKLKKYYDIAKAKGYSDICQQIADYVAMATTIGEKHYNDNDLKDHTYNDFYAAKIAADKQAAIDQAAAAKLAAEEAEKKRPLNILKQMAEDKAPKVVTNGMTLDEVEDWEEALFNDIVSGSGMSDTLAGEILSAWNYGCYRLLNDGDWWYGFGETFNPNSQRALHYLQTKIGGALGNAANYANDEHEFIKQGCKIILNKIFKEKLYDYRCGREWRDYPVK